MQYFDYIRIFVFRNTFKTKQTYEENIFESRRPPLRRHWHDGMWKRQTSRTSY